MKNNNFDNLQKYLSNLGTMFKKRGNNSENFRNLLRSNLVDKAGAEEATKGARTFRRFFLNRLLPVTAACLLVLLLIQIILPGGRVDLIPKLVDTAFAYEQFQLDATDQDLTGVNTESGFLLTSKKTISVSELKDVLLVTPAAEFDWEQVSDNEILLNPKTKLKEGEVYKFSLNTQEIKSLDFDYEYDWAFQISEDLRVRYTIPGNKITSIPINTGIEINLTQAGVRVEDIANYWEITPATKGKFQLSGKSIVFVPTGGLQEKTLYTVKLKSGLPIAGSEKNLLNDYVFQFETGTERYDYLGDLSFMREAIDLATNQEQQLSFYFYDSENYDLRRGYFALNVYKFKKGEDYLASRQLVAEKAPYWSDKQNRSDLVDFDKLDLVQEVPEAIAEKGENSSGFTLDFPEKLTRGYYIATVQAPNGLKDQVFIQVSDTAVYYDFQDENSVIWVNDLETGKPAEKAAVNLGDKIHQLTDSEGTVHLKDSARQLNTDHNDDGYVLVPMTIKLNDFTTYYLVDFYDYEDTDLRRNWQLISTDRDVYHPSDTVNYWFFLQGRDKKVNGKAEVVLVEDNLIVFDYSGKSTWLNAPDLIEPIYSQEITLRDGGVQSGKIKINNLDEGKSYRLGVQQNGKWLTSKYLSVQDFIKPAYDISIQTDNRLLYPGETFDVKVSANFFDGTPVPDTPISFSEKKYTTDAEGNILIKNKEIEDHEDHFGLISYQYLYANAFNEEAANITDYLNVLAYRSRAVADKVEFNKDGFATQIHALDLSKVDRSLGTEPPREDVLADPIPGVKVTAVLSQQIWKKTESGEYYDAIDKVTKKSYYYSQEEKFLKKLSLTSDAKGNINYKFAEPLDTFGADSYYTLNLDITDKDGNSYTESSYLGNSYYPGTDPTYNLEIESGADKTTYKAELGANVKVKIAGGKQLPDNAYYLYSQSTKDLSEFTISNEQNYQFKFTKDQVPSTSLSAIIFDGKDFSVVTPLFIGFDYSARELEVEVEANKDSYEPGEEVEFQVSLKNKNNRSSAAGFVNINLVDEAYYALYAESLLDPLANIYGQDYDVRSFSYASHVANLDTGSGDKGGCFIAGTKILLADGSVKPIEDIKTGDQILTRKSEFSDELVVARVKGTTVKPVGEYLLVNGSLGVTAEHVLFINGQWQKAEFLKVGDKLTDQNGHAVNVKSVVSQKAAHSVKVYNFEVEGYHTYFADGFYVHNQKGGRVDFKDTAYFEVVETDRNGKAKVKFKLPDNITEWRISAVAISGGNEILAGSSSVGLKVTKPLFALPVIKDIYLSDDAPLVPLRAFGTLLKSGQAVTLKMAIDSFDKFVEQEGKAFRNTYFELKKLGVGSHTATFEAELGSDSDRLTLPFTIKDSNLTKQIVSKQKLQDGSKLKAESVGRVNVDFVASELSDIYNLMWEAVSSSSARADYAVAKDLAAKWLGSYFDQSTYVAPVPGFTYQNRSFDNNFDGGIALVPYADTDLELSAKLALLDAEKWNRENLITYFEKELAQKNTLSEKLQALTGLAALNSPVLARVKALVKDKDLSAQEKLWAALAFNASLDRSNAAKYFVELLTEPLLEVDGKIENLRSRLLLAYLAVELRSNEQFKLWDDALKSVENLDRTVDDSVILEQFLYMKSRLALGSLDSTASVRISGKNIKLKAYDVYEASYLPQELSNLKIDKVAGAVTAVLRYAEPVSSLANVQAGSDDRISITRSYFVDDKEVDAFKPGALVKVNFKVSTPQELSGTFTLTDILPSGLSAVTQPFTGLVYGEGTIYPYYQQGQVSRFNLYCDPKAESVQSKCTAWSGFYWARVVNAGEFVVEPAVIEKTEEPTIYKFSNDGKREKIVIEKGN